MLAASEVRIGPRRSVSSFLASIVRSRLPSRLMSEAPFVPYRIILIRGGELSPAEDFGTAIVAARQARAMGQDVWQIKQGDDVILEGDERGTVIANDPERLCPAPIPGRPHRQAVTFCYK